MINHIEKLNNFKKNINLIENNEGIKTFYIKYDFIENLIEHNIIHFIPQQIKNSYFINQKKDKKIRLILSGEEENCPQELLNLYKLYRKINSLEKMYPFDIDEIINYDNTQNKKLTKIIVNIIIQFNTEFKNLIDTKKISRKAF